MAYNTLVESIIRISTEKGSHVHASLPETYALLMRDEVLAFPTLRPHQRHAWHAFLVQLGTMAMHKADLTEPPEDINEWVRIIRALTPDYPDDEPWQMVVEDITKPAFMQPPASSKDKEKDYKNKVRTPDELDMLVTAKNHDLKTAIASTTAVDDWLFALVSLQTMEGFSGSGNYGISRMNSSYGNRPAFSITPSPRLGLHIRRDIVALLEHRSSIIDEYPMIDTGVGLLWTIPWDGVQVEALLLKDLHPFYIEICRRIRLRPEPGGKLYGIKATSKAARIEAKALKGRTGDPWTPINHKEGKALTLAKDGFTYKRTVDYFTPGDWEQPPLLKPTQFESRSSQRMMLVARGMVRGKGKTEGYYERIIPLRTKISRLMGRPTGMQELGAIAQERIAQVGIIQRILRHAVSVFAAGGDNGNVSPDHRARANPWTNKLDEIVDADFFDKLQTEFEADEVEREGIRNEWLHDVVKEARNILDDAEDALPCPAIRRYRARVRAEGIFEGRIRRDMSFLFTEE